MASSFKIDQLTVRVAQTAAAAGLAAGLEVAEHLRQSTNTNKHTRVVFAAAPSQTIMLSTLRIAAGIDWSRIEAFQMDEYVGLPDRAPQRFENWLRRNLFDHVDAVFRPLSSAAEYHHRLGSEPVDLVCLGIGENGHLAFNDPPLARFDDDQNLRTVELTVASRVQQVHDGLFDSIDDVPTQALTLTIPRLMASHRVIGIACGPLKAPAVQRTLTHDIDPSCPATALRTHPASSLHTDTDAWPH